MTFAEELKAWRHDVEMTQQEAATYLRVGVSTLGDWEQERHKPSSLGPIRHLMELKRRERKAVRS